MKQYILYLLSLVVCATAEANPGPLPVAASTTSAAATKTVMNAGAVRFQFNTIISSHDYTDSVLVIFDRYDHTGAGVIYQMYAADSLQGIDITNVPAGKYYVTIQCVGVHHDRMEKVITVKSRKNEKVRIKLDDTEVFSKDGVVIPAFRPDFADMAVLKTK
jgi:hypothetical protein